MNDSLVLSEYLSLGIEEFAARIVLAGIPPQKCRIIAVRDKANVLTVMLPCIEKLLFLGDLTHFWLMQSAQREQCVGELLLCHRIQHIALILALIQRLFQLPPSGFLIVLNARIMTGRNIVALQLPGTVIQPLKLEIPVAVDAGIRRPSALIGTDKPLDDLLIKGIHEIKPIVRHVQTICHIARIPDIVLTAAGRMLVLSDSFIVVQTHRCAHAVISLLAQQIGGHAGIDAAAHRDQNPAHDILLAFPITFRPKSAHRS